MLRIIILLNLGSHYTNWEEVLFLAAIFFWWRHKVTTYGLKVLIYINNKNKIGENLFFQEKLSGTKPVI